MRKLTRAAVQQNYRDSALKLLIKHQSPTQEDVHVHLCMRDHCPSELCTNPGGFKNGYYCGHVISVKKMIDKMLLVVNGD